jgi:tetratricopeptide (TPR) repeat protein
MELVEGSTLDEIVTENGPMNMDEALAVGRDLCGALEALHQAGVVHRDIKARNVMRESTGRVVLMDLGLSCEVDREIPLQHYGTPLYAAPEVLLADESSPQSDLYSLGVLLYFLVSRSYPVTGSTLSDIHEAHGAGQLKPLGTIRPDLPEGFIRAIDKALARDRNERFATAIEFRQALEDVMETSERCQRESFVDDKTEYRQAKAYTGDERAYSLYLQGRHLWNRRDDGALPNALDYFRRAIARDPDFAPALVGVAECLNLLSYHQYIRPREGFAEARRNAERALAIDPGLGEAHSALGWIYTFHDWDTVSAEREFKRAIQLNPSYTAAHRWYAIMLSSAGRHDEAVAIVRAIRDQDPTTVFVSVDASTLANAGYVDEALRIYRSRLEVNPESLINQSLMGFAYILKKDLDAAESCLQKACEISRGEDMLAAAFFGLVLAVKQRRDKAQELLNHLDKLSRKRYVSFFSRMLPWIVFDREDKWVPLLEHAIYERDPLLVWGRTVGHHLQWIMVPKLIERLRNSGLMDCD